MMDTGVKPVTGEERIVIPFVARSQELEVLERLYATPTFQFVPIYGRRRVGKTALIKRFLAGKTNVFYFTGRETTATENLFYLSNVIQAQLAGRAGYDVRDASLAPGDEVDSRGLVHAAPVYANLGQALEAVFALAMRPERGPERPVIVFDEYPYLAKSDPSASSILQSIIDRIGDGSTVMLILCGSSTSFMKTEVLGEKSPLYGRRTAQLDLRPMDVFDACEVLRVAPAAEGRCDPSAEFVAQAYGVAGGIPLYLEQLDPTLPFEQNLAERALAEDSFLYCEPTNYLLQSVKAYESYNAVLAAVASGRTQPTQIAGVSGINANSITSYLRKLEELQIAERRAPVPRKNGGRPGYRLCDNLFAFWYAISTRYADAIGSRQGALVAARIMRQEFPTYMGPVFEELCRQWVRREMARGRIDALVGTVGKWWGTDPVTRRQADIDVVATTHDDLLVLGECKWHQQPMDVGVLQTLEGRSLMFEERRKLLIGFSRAGFTEGAAAYAAERPYLRLISLDALFDE